MPWIIDPHILSNAAMPFFSFASLGALRTGALGGLQPAFALTDAASA
jgi:hypothetical protein